MNKDRRKQLDKVMAALEAAKDQFEAAVAALVNAKEDAEAIRDEEQEAYDNLPESLQDGEKGQQMLFAVEKIEEAINALDEVPELDFDEIVQALDEAKAA